MAKQWGVEAAVRIYSLRRTLLAVRRTRGTGIGRERLSVDMLPQRLSGTEAVRNVLHSPVT